jgi:hypothetical protein
MPTPPMGRSAANKFAHALTKEPGTGGVAWAAAWSRIEVDLAERFADHPKAGAEIEKRLTRYKEWTTCGLYNRTEGIPAEAARLIAARVSQWAIEADRGGGDPLLLTVASMAAALSHAIDVLNQEVLSALLVERMLDQVLADGAQNPDHIATAGGLRCVKHPSALWAPAPRVIWWDFKGPGDRVPQSPWSRSELMALSGVGCALETSPECASRIGWSYTHAVNMASECLILVRPSLSGGEETTSHPLAHQLDPMTRLVGGAIRWKAEQLLDGDVHTLAGRTLHRVEQVFTSTPQARAQWKLPTSAIARLQGRTESASSFERLMDCQLRWVLLDVLSLSRGRFAEIPGPDQLIGNLAHEIANSVLPAGLVAPGEVIGRQAEDIFEDLLSAIAAPLLQPEFAGELAAARKRVPMSLANLAEILRKKGLAIVGTEVDRAADFKNGLSVRGRLDLLVDHPINGLGVIDLKWTKSAKHRRDQLAEGRALQLATYGAIADPNGGGPVVGAYYLLNQRRLIGLKGTLVADEEIDTARSLEATWNEIMNTWQAWLDIAASGSALAAGVPGAADIMPDNLSISPSQEPCRYCELTSLCRIGAEEI